MKIWTVVICGSLSACAVLGFNNRSVASEDQPSAPTDPAGSVSKPKASGQSSSNSNSPRSRPRRKIATARKKSDGPKNEAAKAQPWFDVDPDRARTPTTAKETPPKTGEPAAPAARWSKDRFDFNYKVNGTNDVRMMPRFDPNQNPDGSMGRGEGASGEVGVNLHF